MLLNPPNCHNLKRQVTRIRSIYQFSPRRRRGGWKGFLWDAKYIALARVGWVLVGIMLEEIWVHHEDPAYVLIFFQTSLLTSILLFLHFGSPKPLIGTFFPLSFVSVGDGENLSSTLHERLKKPDLKTLPGMKRNMSDIEGVSPTAGVSRWRQTFTWDGDP